jgi:hypothetical protein
MAVATFDFTNLRIILPAGDVTVEVERDLYSAWKRASLLSSANMAAPPAFRASVGGDPLGGGLDAGAYFFLQNQDGWRIRPAEADATVTLTGNIIPEDPLLPLSTPTLGAFTVLINNIQPITQGTSEILEVSQQTLYMSTVFFDAISGVAGTIFPTGTAEQPSNNLTDALAIMADVGANILSVRGLLTLDQDFTKKKIVGTTNTLLDRVSLATFDVDETTFMGLEIAGTGQGTVLMERCLLDNIDGMVGEWKDCGFLNNVTLATGTSYFIDCWSAVQGNTKPTLNCGNVLVDVGFRRYTGGLSVLNFSNALNTGSFDLVSADLLLNASVSAGDIVVRGVGTFTNNSTGTPTIVKNGFVDGLDVKLIKALDAGNVTITGSSPFVVEVLDPDDNITPIARFDVSADGRTRTRTL